MNIIKIGNNWQSFLDKEMAAPYYSELREFLKEEYRTQTVYPPAGDIFNAFKFTDLEDVKVVIIGQDPYHGKGQAMGLSFSVQEGIRIPPSLLNVYKEINAELRVPMPDSGNLKRWTEQGVFLLNSCLTVREKSPKSHNGKGWEIFTRNTIAYLNKHPKPKVFMLWGGDARKLKKYITNPIHLVLEAKHPSPMATKPGDKSPDSFFGCGHFLKANRFLSENNLKEVIW